MDKYIIAIDPGKVTGIAVLHLTDNSFALMEVNHLEDPDYVWEPIYDLITRYTETYDDVVVLCESFELRPDVAQPDETPKYIIKDLERYVAPHYPIEYQMASQAKVGIPPGRNGRRDRLHSFGLHQRGYRHANDAIRHCLVYAIDKLRHRPLIVRGWGVPGRNK